MSKTHGNSYESKQSRDETSAPGMSSDTVDEKEISGESEVQEETSTRTGKNLIEPDNGGEAMFGKAKSDETHDVSMSKTHGNSYESKQSRDETSAPGMSSDTVDEKEISGESEVQEETSTRTGKDLIEPDNGSEEMFEKAKADNGELCKQEGVIANWNLELEEKIAKPNIGVSLEAANTGPEQKCCYSENQTAKDEHHELIAAPTDEQMLEEMMGQEKRIAGSAWRQEEERQNEDLKACEEYVESTKKAAKEKSDHVVRSSPDDFESAAQSQANSTCGSLFSCFSDKPW